MNGIENNAVTVEIEVLDPIRALNGSIGVLGVASGLREVCRQTGWDQRYAQVLSSTRGTHVKNRPVVILLMLSSEALVC